MWRALAIRWEQFGSILQHHHTTEDDVLWPQPLEIADGLTEEQLAAAICTVGKPFEWFLAMVRRRSVRQEAIACRFGQDVPAPHPSQARGGSLQAGRF